MSTWRLTNTALHMVECDTVTISGARVLDCVGLQSEVISKACATTTLVMRAGSGAWVV